MRTGSTRGRLDALGLGLPNGDGTLGARRAVLGSLRGHHHRIVAAAFGEHRGLAGAGEGAGQMLLDERGHLGVADAAGPAAEHYSHQVAVAGLGGCQEVEARGAGVAGLDAVHAVHAPEKAVVVAVVAAGVLEAAGLEIAPVAGESGRESRGRAP